MPGQGGDAPGLLVLRDAGGWIRGVTSLALVQSLHGIEPDWSGGRISVPLHAEFRFPHPTPLAPLVAAIWRLRAAIGLLPADTSHR